MPASLPVQSWCTVMASLLASLLPLMAFGIRGSNHVPSQDMHDNKGTERGPKPNETDHEKDGSYANRLHCCGPRAGKPEKCALDKGKMGQGGAARAGRAARLLKNRGSRVGENRRGRTGMGLLCVQNQKATGQPGMHRIAWRKSRGGKTTGTPQGDLYQGGTAYIIARLNQTPGVGNAVVMGCGGCSWKAGALCNGAGRQGRARGHCEPRMCG